MECLKNLRSGLRTISQSVQVVCELSFQILTSTEKLISLLRRGLKEEQARILEKKNCKTPSGKESNMLLKTKY